MNSCRMNRGSVLDPNYLGRGTRLCQELCLFRPAWFDSVGIDMGSGREAVQVNFCRATFRAKASFQHSAMVSEYWQHRVLVGHEWCNTVWRHPEYHT